MVAHASGLGIYPNPKELNVMGDNPAGFERAVTEFLAEIE